MFGKCAKSLCYVSMFALCMIGVCLVCALCDNCVLVCIMCDKCVLNLCYD